MAHVNTSGIPGDAADFLVASDVIDTDAHLLAELGEVPPGTRAHTAGYAVIKEKDLDGSWTEVS